LIPVAVPLGVHFDSSPGPQLCPAFAGLVAAASLVKSYENRRVWIFVAAAAGLRHSGAPGNIQDAHCGLEHFDATKDISKIPTELRLL
jgi:hypothetical protein